MNDMPGYDYGTPRVAPSPVALDELRRLEQSVGWTEGDTRALKMAGEVLKDQAEALVDSWRRDRKAAAPRQMVFQSGRQARRVLRTRSRPCTMPGSRASCSTSPCGAGPTPATASGDAPAVGRRDARAAMA